MSRNALCTLVLVSLAASIVAQPPAGPEFQVNTHTTSHQFDPAVGPIPGGFVVAWSSGDYPQNFTLQAQRYVEPQVFADGFESGDTSAWSATVP